MWFNADLRSALHAAIEQAEGRRQMERPASARSSRCCRSGSRLGAGGRGTAIERSLSLRRTDVGPL
jgi:hypothetical protein